LDVRREGFNIAMPVHFSAALDLLPISNCNKCDSHFKSSVVINIRQNVMSNRLKVVMVPSFIELIIQGVPGGKVNIMGGHSIGHSKQKTFYQHVSYSERFPRQSHLTSDSGAAGREERTLLGALAKPLYSQMALSRKPFGIGHMFI
jgi:hypothetical protein